MTILYKLTTFDFKTRPGEYNECLWGENVSHSGTGEGDLCGPGFIHAYTDPLLAVFLNPLHAGYINSVLWECEGKIIKNDHGLKVGCKTLTTLRIIPLPIVTQEQYIKFGILCALESCDTPEFVTWAHKWLSGVDRTHSSAKAVANANTLNSSAHIITDMTSAVTWDYVTHNAPATVAYNVTRGVVAIIADIVASNDNSLDLIALAHKAVA